MKYLKLAALVFGSTVGSQAAVLINDDFSSSVVNTNARFRADQVGLGWYASNQSTLWNISGGVVSNAGTVAGIPSEGGFGQSITTTSTDSIISFSFDYTVGAGTTLYFHAQGLTVNGTPDANEQLANTGSQNGSVQNQADQTGLGDDYGDINLFDGGDPNGGTGNAIAFAGGTSGTYTGTFDVSTYSWDDSTDESPGLTGSISNLSDFDILFFAFAANTTDLTNGQITIDNFNVSTVPEPSSALLIGLACTATLLRRRR